MVGAISFLIGLMSCVKDNPTKPDTNIVYDTIKPLDYFPAFPGSYWVYDSNDTLKVAEDYELYVFNSAGYTAEPDYDTLVLPKLRSNRIYNSGDSCAFVNGYSISKGENSETRDPSFKSILSETEGSTFTIGGRWQYHQIMGKTIKTDTSIMIGDTKYDKVLITIEFDVACNEQGGYPVDSCAYKREYYAKGIGLIKRESGGYIPNENWITDFELKEYDIKK